MKFLYILCKHTKKCNTWDVLRGDQPTKHGFYPIYRVYEDSKGKARYQLIEALNET